MGKKFINIGASVNDSNADTVRQAFDKVNDNFTELYNELTDDGSTLSSLAFSGSALISDTTNGDINFTPNGTGVIYANADFNVNKIKSNDSAFVTVDDGLLVTGSFTFDGGSSVNTILDEDTMSSDSDTALATQQSIKAYVDSQIGGANTLTIGDNASNEISLSLDDTLNVLGTQNVTASVAGDTLTITGPDLSSYLTSTSIIFGDSGSNTTTINNGGTLNIVGTQNLTAAITGDTLTITGPNLTNYVQNTDSAITLVGDDSTGTSVNIGEIFKIAGTQNVTTAVSGDVLTITGPDLSSYLTSTSIIFGDSGSSTTTVNNGGTLNIVGTQNVTAAITGDTLTITGPNLSTYHQSGADVVTNNISSSDSTAVQINDSVNISGTLAVDTIDTNVIRSEDSAAIQIIDDMNIGGNLYVSDQIFTSKITSDDSAQILVGQSLQVNGNISMTSDFVTQGSVFTDTISSYASNQNLDVSANGTGVIQFNSNTQHTSSTSAKFGANSDLSISNDGNNSFVQHSNTGDLYLKSTNNIFIQTFNSEASVYCNRDGSVDLYYDNAKKFGTSSTGATTFGDHTVQGSVIADTITSGTSNEDLNISAQGTGNILFGTATVLYTDTSDPAGVNGMMYYNSSTHKFRGYVNGVWTDLN